MNCRECQENSTLFVYGELPAEQSAAYQSHLDECAGCRSETEKVRRLHTVLGQRPLREPSPELLFECRQALDEALDREEVGWHGLVRQWLIAFPLRPAPGLALALALMVFGFGLGWTLRPGAGRLSSESPALDKASLAGADLENMRISGISRVAPDPKTGDVRITMDAERRMTLEGSLDDPRIRQVLVYAVKNYNNPGIRRDTLDALRMRLDNPSVREALLFALRNDRNAGVRLEALQAVQGMECGEDVHRALLAAVDHDSNPGVRVAAVDALVDHVEAEGRDEAVEQEFKRLAASDQNACVRFKCANAVRELTR